jgi:hypothetical protein
MARRDIFRDGENTRFSSSNQPDNRGRKPSKLKKFIKEYDISLQDIQILMKNIMFAYSFEEIQELVKKTEKLPVAVGVIIKGLADDANSGRIAVFEKMMDRSFGKTAPEKTVEVRGMSEEARSRMAVLLREETAAADGGNVPEPPHIIPRNTLKDDDDQ